MVTIEWQKMPPRKDEDPGEELLFPRMKDNGVTRFSSLCEKASAGSVFGEGELIAAFSNLMAQFVREMKEGRSVELRGLGTFRLSLGTRDKVTMQTQRRNDKVVVKGLNFTPSKTLLKGIGHPDFYCQPIDAKPVTTQVSELVEPLRVYLSEHNSIKRQEFQDLFCLKCSTAKIRLRELVRMGVLRVKGTNRDTVYVKA